MWCSAIGCIVTLTLSMLVAPLTVEAQQTGKAGSRQRSACHRAAASLFWPDRSGHRRMAERTDF